VGGRLIRLPKLIERDPRAEKLLSLLTSETRLLWPGGEFQVPTISVDQELARTLRNAHRAGRVSRGLEAAKEKLAAEERGLRMADRHAPVSRGSRVSRLLLAADDGAERFYRHVETLLRRYSPRVLGIRLEMDAAAMGELLYGPNHPVRLLLIEHKEAVCSVLLAMASQTRRISNIE